MAYTYCRSCDSGLNEPTFAEAVAGEMECPWCNKPHKLEHNERDESLILLEQRVAAIEKHLGI